MKYQNKVPVQLIIWHCFARKTKACHFTAEMFLLKPNKIQISLAQPERNLYSLTL